MCIDVEMYKPKVPPRDDREPLKEVFERVKEKDDDGHSAKFVRAIAHGKDFCAKYEGQEGFKMNEALWDKLEHMAIDSVEDSGATWARSVGFDEAWVDFKDRPLAWEPMRKRFHDVNRPSIRWRED